MKITKNPNIMLAGSVNSSKKTLQKLIEHDMNITGVLGLHPDRSKNVSGYCDLKKLADDAKIPFLYFSKINDEEIISFIEDHKPDLLFVIGLSQLIHEKLLNIPTYGCVGFHPTRLPEGRGRGAIAWLVLGKTKGAATFFILDEGMDSGPILVQENFEVGKDDYAQDVINNLLVAIGRALDKLLPEMKKGQVDAKEQDDTKASYLARRKPADGLINWHKSAKDIYKLIRAVSAPLPGAYTYYKGNKIVIEKAELEHNKKIIGIEGRIVEVADKGLLVQTGDGLIWVTKLEGLGLSSFKVGEDFGINYESELHKLKSYIRNLNQ